MCCVPNQCQRIKSFRYNYITDISEFENNSFNVLYIGIAKKSMINDEDYVFKCCVAIALCQEAKLKLKECDASKLFDEFLAEISGQLQKELILKSDQFNIKLSFDNIQNTELYYDARPFKYKNDQDLLKEKAAEVTAAIFDQKDKIYYANLTEFGE